ncbi:hypothetical protein SADUNF_Sadunf04G0111900 [Salix dunnii]|uniref:Uncharacterized protein n=1 Tax=Salix dunnii TaxID=1413687 RepID=A0A835KEC4_9ROSI|nr:hypothetical protein SADUNF_Sadunf04G0111900 [Salix dunnii]
MEEFGDEGASVVSPVARWEHDAWRMYRYYLDRLHLILSIDKILVSFWSGRNMVVRNRLQVTMFPAWTESLAGSRDA